MVKTLMLLQKQITIVQVLSAGPNIVAFQLRYIELVAAGDEYGRC